MKKDDRKEKIIKAAIKIMAKNGYTHAKMTDIADEAGVASGLIYSRHFFINKLDLLLSIVLTFWTTLNNKIEIELSDNLDPTKKIQLIVDIVDGLLTKNIDGILLSKVIHETIPISYFIKEEELQAKREQITMENRKLLESVDRIIEEGQETGVFEDTLKPQVMRQALFGAYEFLLYGLSLKISRRVKDIGYYKNDIPKVMSLLITKFILK